MTTPLTILMWAGVVLAVVITVACLFGISLWAFAIFCVWKDL